MFSPFVEEVLSEMATLDQVLWKMASLNFGDPDLTSQMKTRVETLQSDLGFLKKLNLGSYLKYLGKSKSYIGAALEIGKRKLHLFGTSDRATSQRQQEVKIRKQRIRECCLFLLDFSASCKFSSTHELLEFIDSTVSNLGNLVRLKPRGVVSVRMQVKAVIKKLRMFRDFVRYTDERLFFGINIQFWAYRISCLSTMYWVNQTVSSLSNLNGWDYMYWYRMDQMEVALVARMNVVHSDLLQMVKSCSAEFVGLYIGVLNTSKSASSLETMELYHRVLEASRESIDNFQTHQVIESFVDSLLPPGAMEILRQKLTFLISFLMDPPEGKKDAEKVDLPGWEMKVEEGDPLEWELVAETGDPTEWEMVADEGDLILKKVKAVASKIPTLICSLVAGERNESTVEERNVLLRDFLQRTDKVKSEVRNFYVQNPDSSRPYFPVFDALGFMDLFLENFGNLKAKANYLPFAEDNFVTLHKELASLGPFLKPLQDLHNELEMKDLWTRITDVIYQAEYAIDSCQMTDIPVWYNVIRLSDVLDEMKFIKREMQEIMQKRAHNIGVLNETVNSDSIHLHQPHISRPDELVVGFEDNTEEIINHLTSRTEKLEIVSIVGMPGQGKTTLAKKVYHSPPIQNHFQKRAWCFVTQVYEVKVLLLDILRAVHDDEIHTMSKEDLAVKLYRCLKGKRYLIVMDDIWDITAWNALKLSFPDDNNGSRILFTSRHQFGCDPHLLRQLFAAVDYRPYLLRPLSEEESMELLSHKLIFDDGWPSNFSRDVQKILNICRGLPLAIVVVAGLLKKASTDFQQWRQIIKNLDTELANEECMDILELSYKNLPAYLRPCFLYLGAVGQTTKVFKVYKLIQLWIAEGFVRKSEKKSIEDVAIEYLKDLVGRNLVIVNKRSFTGGKITECRIHDLLHELCLKKAAEERFMHFSSIPPYPSKPTGYAPYRLCIYSREMAYFWRENTSPIVRSLLFPPCNHYLDDIFSGFLSRLKFVRVLDLWNVGFGNRFPEAIVSFICLRYLAIRTDGVEIIPSSIANLCNLESFHLKSWKNVLQFPYTIWKMKHLRNVDVVGTAVATILLDDHDANECPMLENLDSFSSLILSNVEDAEKILGRFPRVRKLKLEFSTSWECSRDCDPFLVLYLPRMLESLNLQYSGKGVHTCAFELPKTLKSLTLFKFNRPWIEISAIGKLPNLQVLKFVNSAIVGERWDIGDDEFLNLKYLKLTLLKISRWEASSSSFPCLERLVVRHCRFLEELPSIFGEVLTLKMIEVRRCPKGLCTSAQSILDEQRDMGNEDLEVLISDILDEDRTSSSIGLPSSNGACFNSYSPGAIPYISLENLYDPQLQMLEHLLATQYVQEPLELDKNGFLERSVACAKKTVRSKNVSCARRRTNFRLKHNCQPRKVIFSRYRKEELKRDG